MFSGLDLMVPIKAKPGLIAIAAGHREISHRRSCFVPWLTERERVGERERKRGWEKKSKVGEKGERERVRDNLDNNSLQWRRQEIILLVSLKQALRAKLLNDIS